jgi:hypothetical protein
MTTSSGTKPVRDDEITHLLYRVRGGYLEMPGLRLTVPQAARLWALDPITSGQLLDDLTRVGFLVKSRDGAYVRPSAA